jgi:hypothetical protein
MLQVMDNMETSCVFYVKVGMFIHLEQSKICLLSVKISGMEMLTVGCDIIVSVIFI